MSSSLRSRVNKLAYEGHITQSDADRIRDALAKVKLDNAIEFLKATYERALTLEYVRNPLEWALYETWKEFKNE